MALSSAATTRCPSDMARCAASKGSLLVAAGSEECLVAVGSSAGHAYGVFAGGRLSTSKALASAGPGQVALTKGQSSAAPQAALISGYGTAL